MMLMCIYIYMCVCIASEMMMMHRPPSRFASVRIYKRRFTWLAGIHQSVDASHVGQKQRGSRMLESRSDAAGWGKKRANMEHITRVYNITAEMKCLGIATWNSPHLLHESFVYPSFIFLFCFRKLMSPLIYIRLVVAQHRRRRDLGGDDFPPWTIFCWVENGCVAYCQQHRDSGCRVAPSVIIISFFFVSPVGDRRNATQRHVAVALRLANLTRSFIIFLKRALMVGF